MPTVLAFHAHPDDEVLLTGGTLALLAAGGHRVVIVVATCDMRGDLDSPRLAELAESARILGVAEVIHLGYADSGHGRLLYPDPPGGPTRFVRADPAEAATRLAGIITAEGAELLLSYDAQGGYHHRDHVRVHEVGALAAAATGVRVLEATLPREPVARFSRLLRRFGYHGLSSAYTPRAEITHRVDVRAFAARKQAALAAHRTPLQGGGRSAAVFRLLVRLPAPVFGLLLGREYFAEARPGRSRRRARGSAASPR